MLFTDWLFLAKIFSNLNTLAKLAYLWVSRRGLFETEARVPRRVAHGRRHRLRDVPGAWMLARVHRTPQINRLRNLCADNLSHLGVRASPIPPRVTLPMPLELSVSTSTSALHLFQPVRQCQRDEIEPERLIRNVDGSNPAGQLQPGTEPVTSGFRCEVVIHRETVHCAERVHQVLRAVAYQPSDVVSAFVGQAEALEALGAVDGMKQTRINLRRQSNCPLVCYEKENI